MQSDAWAAEWQTCTGDFGINNGASGERVKKLGNAKLYANQRQAMHKFTIKLSLDKVVTYVMSISKSVTVSTETFNLQIEI